MANLKSAQKQARQNVKKRERNLARRSSIKTAVKKVLASIEKSDSLETIQILFKDAQAQLSRAKNKGVLHSNTVQRKIGRLAKKVAAAHKEHAAPAQK